MIQKSITPSKKGTLYIGDNLDILKTRITDEHFDLIYLDPPFNSNRNYNSNFKDGTQERIFEDTWDYNKNKVKTDKEFQRIEIHNEKLASYLLFIRDGLKEEGLFAYLTFMASRLNEMRRVLKSTGSIYLHCDPTASHYLKLIMDIIFGEPNFRNEIIWGYGNRATVRRTGFPQKHDTIFWYSKTATYVYKEILKDYKDPELKRYNQTDDEGKKYALIKRTRADGEIYYGKTYPRDGVPLTDVWDIPLLASTDGERLGYPTQKPEALLERIINASCPREGRVLDPFCGCGTSCAVAAKLGIDYVGIDISSKALEIITKRFADAALEMPAIEHKPTDGFTSAALAKDDKYGFQKAICEKLGFKWDNKKGADGGIDGEISFIDPSDKTVQKAIIQVKGGGVKTSDIRDLHGVIVREDAAIGIFATLNEPTKSMMDEANRIGYYRDNKNNQFVLKIQIITSDDIYNNNKRVKYPEGAKFE
jgi:site-specific DNA-methyltransferase (adenine-specific)